MSTIEPAALASATPLNAQLTQRLLSLRQRLHRAYCTAVCLDRALRYNETDDSPELAVCVREYLVHPLDALSVEAEELHEALKRGPATQSMTADESSEGDE